MTEKLLAVIPHADDESIFFGGTLAKYAELGADVDVLLITNGDKGRILNPDPVTGQEKLQEAPVEKRSWLVEEREREFRQALYTLHVDSYDSWNMPTREIEVRRDSVEKMKQYLKEKLPHVIVSFNEAGTTLHQDHIASTVVLYTAIRELLTAHELPHFLRYLTLTVPHAPALLDKFGELPTPPDQLTRIDVRPYIALKKQASHAHKTQAHIVEAMEKRKILDVPHELYLERITRSNSSARGKTDVFIGMNKASDIYTFDSLPKKPDQYRLSDKEIFMTWSRPKIHSPS